MRIALIGYGKMGRMIESAAMERGHKIVCVIEANTDLTGQSCGRLKIYSPTDGFTSEDFRSADVAIEFSRPDAAERNVREAWKQGVAVVSGTTGWDVGTLKAEMAGREHAGVIWSSNYSVGVNVLFAVNRYLAQLLHKTGGYNPSITEVHHVHKLDAPSGTAVTLREGIVGGKSHVESGECPIESIREGEVPGIHEVRWESEADILTLRHDAKSRKGFALGAVLAAEWLCGKTGWHTMKEVMGIED